MSCTRARADSVNTSVCPRAAPRLPTSATWLSLSGLLRVVWVSGAFLPGPDAVGVLLEVDGCGAGAGSPTAAVMALLACALPAALAAVTFTSNVAP